MNMMVLEKYSSLLGYHNETPGPLNANHHDVCKYTSPDDPNYKTIRSALRSIVKMLRLSEVSDRGTEKDLKTIQKWLGVTGSPEEDIFPLRSVRKAGTCEDLLEKPEFQSWLQSDRPHILWANAPPGSGKSIQFFFVIDYLSGQQGICAFWFFKDGDLQKRSLGNMFRSVAYQIAVKDATFRRALTEVAKSGMQIDKADASTVWRNVFASKLSAMSSELYWVVDGLDESESSRVFIDLISNISKAQKSIRVLFFSRPLSNIKQAIQRAKKRIDVTNMALSDNLKDIRLVATDEMEYFLSNEEFEEFKQDTIEEITSRSQGNFLWASLILKQVISCHRQEEVKRVLRTTPDGMERLYDGMTEATTKVDKEENTYLCKILLSWAMYSTRPIRVEELMEPYAAELRTVMDLKHTINELCGQFVVINANDQLVLVHQTAREYLKASTKLPFSLDASEVNEQLLLQCLNALSDLSLRMKIRQRRVPLFLSYAAISWASHLNRSSVESDGVLEALVNFFSNTFPLPWIQFLAINGQLSHLVAVSSHIMNFVRRRRKADAIKPPPLLRLPELSLLETWAIDLLKMTAKFGTHLIDEPDAIFKYIPSLSPESSILYQMYANKSAATISVSGLSNADWDDCLVRVPNGSDPALHIAVSAEYLAVANDSPNGRIRLWNNVIFQEHYTFDPGEPICFISFSQSGSLLACYGLKNTYVWNVSDGSLVATVESPYRERAKALEFERDESSLIIATDLRRVYRLDLYLKPPTWISFSPSLLEETSLPEGAFINSPSSVAFNPDCTQLAVGYRGFPLAVWSLDPPEMISRCKRKEKQGRTINVTWTGVNRVIWHPFNGQVLGIYRDGNIFKWGPMDESYEEVKQELDATPSEIQCSSNGLVFATSDVKGSVKIYDYAHMVQIYKLTSDDIINSIAFSPDSRRFYDLRGSYCNVWEPNCLIRLVDTSDDRSEDSESVTSSERARQSISVHDADDKGDSIISFPASEAHANTKPAITAVATCVGNQNIFAYSTEDGTIEIYDIESTRKHLVLHSSFGIDVFHLALAHDGDYVAYCLLNGCVMVKSIGLSSKGDAVFDRTVFAETGPINRGSIRDIFFDSRSQRLFVCGSERLQVLSILDGSIVAEKVVVQTDEHAQWENHPTNPGTILAFTASTVSAFAWDTLEHQYDLSVYISGGTPDSQPKIPLSLKAMSHSYHPKMRLAITSFEPKSGKLSNFLLFDTSVLHEDSSLSPRSGAINAVPIPLWIADRMEQPVGLLADGRVVFLDKALWVCTAQLWPSPAGGSDSDVMRHFFIPRDWVNSAGLVLCRIQADGKFLCPSKGEMAVISSNIGTEW
jgi:WD40 repeat protein